MFRRSELAAGVVVAVTALVLGRSGMGMQLVPVGLVAGLAAVRAPTPMDGLMWGAKAGAFGGTLFVVGTAVGGGLRMAPIVGAHAVDYVLFETFALAWMLVPWYSMTGMAAGPVVQWATEKAVAFERRRADDASG